jgi:DNA polymerase elongation subunit (family B)
MTEYHVQKPESYNRLRQYLEKNDANPEWQGNRLITKDYTFIISDKYRKYLERDIPRTEETNMEDLIYGKDKTENITAVEVVNDKMYLFKSTGELETRDFNYWFLSKKGIKGSQQLDGTLDYKYINFFDDKEKFNEAKKKLWKNSYALFDDAEAAMVLHGITLFKGMQISDVSVLSFDIESEGLLDDNFTPLSDDPNIYLISNTYRDTNGEVTRKLFSLEDYHTAAEMIEEWCTWVQEIDPHIMLGHNIFGYDLPYMNYMYKREYDLDMPLGKRGREIHVNTKASKFRKDGSQEYDYYNIKVFGRQVIDTFFLSIKYDFARNYPSYGLKAIIEYEGLEKEGRIKWDFTVDSPKNTFNNREENPKKWADFKTYCEDDGDDSLKLFDMMAPSFFYYTQSIPKTFQAINNGATGSQINSFLVRSYLQMNHSIPEKSEKVKFQGAISAGITGVHDHVNNIKYMIKKKILMHTF